MSATISVSDNGDLVSQCGSGSNDRVRLHVSRFHGLIVTAQRTYLGGTRSEATAYFGDPQAVANWLAEQDYYCSPPPAQPTQPETTA